MTRAEVGLIEALAARAWPAPETVPLDGWTMRFGGGVTRRANSVLTLADKGRLPLGAKMSAVVAASAARGLPPIVQVSPASVPIGLDAYLAERGYVVDGASIVQTANLPLTRVEDHAAVHVAEALDPAWAAAWWGMERGHALPDVVLTMLGPAAGATAYATVFVDGEVVSVGRGNVESDRLGIVAMATRRDHRRRGHARAVLAALADWGLRQGATSAYLQVESGNTAAQALYRSAGFSDCYRYHYRRPPSTGPGWPSAEPRGRVSA